MTESRVRAWTRSMGRLAVSAFVVVHMAATVIWVLPPCPLRARSFDIVRWYILPTGLWQSWGMFAPDPQRDSFCLEAEVIDARGMRSTFPFPRMSDFPTLLQKFPRFRHPKYAANLLMPDTGIDRKLTARHAVRQLRLPDEAYPLNVSLVYHVRVSPAPGAPTADLMTPPQPIVACTVPFASPGEVSP